MKNKTVFIISLFIVSLFIAFCRTNPPEKVKIIVEHDPVVKNLEEKDSMRKILPDTTKKIINRKH